MYVRQPSVVTVLDSSADRPLYRQLADLIRGQILAGELAGGQTLPSESALSRQYGLGRDAVRDALAVLRAEGLVTTERGRGTWVRESTQRQEVLLNRGDRAIARMPTDHERRDLAVAEGVPVVEVTRADGASEVHPADRTEFGGS